MTFGGSKRGHFLTPYISGLKWFTRKKFVPKNFSSVGQQKSKSLQLARSAVKKVIREKPVFWWRAGGQKMRVAHERMRAAPSSYFSWMQNP